ncbi:MAG: hypothetical protein ACREDU_09700, partial [Methylocella sp.]
MHYEAEEPGDASAAFSRKPFRDGRADPLPAQPAACGQRVTRRLRCARTEARRCGGALRAPDIVARLANIPDIGGALLRLIHPAKPASRPRGTCS